MEGIVSALNYQIPTQKDSQVAAESSRLLAACIGKGDEACLRLIDGDIDVKVPVKAIHLLVEILAAMSKGEAVSLVPFHKELTTQEAANILNVSRPYFVKLLENEELPYRKVGVRRKVLFQDLIDYKEKQDKESKQAMDDLAAEAQEQGYGY